MLVRRWVTTVLWIPEEHYASDENGGDNSDDDNGDDDNGDDFICLQFFPGHSWGVNCNFQKNPIYERYSCKRGPKI